MSFCSFVWVIPGVGLTPVIPNIDDPAVQARGLRFISFMRLDEIGLIQFNNITGFSLKEITAATAFYYGRRHDVSRSDKGSLLLGKALLTSVGSELAPIAGSEPIEEHRQHVVAEWQKEGFAVDQHSEANVKSAV